MHPACDPSRIPVLVGVGQAVQRDVEPDVALGPVEMMRDVALAAAADAGWTGLAALDTVAVVDVLAWHATNAARLLSEAVGATASREIVTAVGGNTPQALVNHFAREIRDGHETTAMVAGVNLLATQLRARERGVHLDWPTAGAGEPESFGDPHPGSSDYENNYQMYLPANVYPLFENALRARRGLSPAEHSLAIGRMFAPFTKVAAANPLAWFPTERSAEEIASAGAGNRMVAFPYTKYMNAVIRVDQAAAVIVTSAARARRLGVPEDRWVWIHGGGDASEDPWFASERPRWDTSPAMHRAARNALGEAGIGVDQINFFDLYSCFPSAVEVACEGLGISETDPRGLTLTGGLPYFGGPGNNYVTHSIAAAADALRARPGTRALVTGNGWFLTKHAAGVYGSCPPEPSGAAGGSIEAGPEPAVELCEAPDGAAEVETYTVLFDRDGAQSNSIVVGRLDDGRRFLAHTPEDRALLEGMLVEEFIGRRGRVRVGPTWNVFDPD
jgi:acetyl-CoA C-acetyltransferase